MAIGSLRGGPARAEIFGFLARNWPGAPPAGVSTQIEIRPVFGALAPHSGADSSQKISNLPANVAKSFQLPNLDGLMEVNKKTAIDGNRRGE
jgi:hypothetical protein